MEEADVALAKRVARGVSRRVPLDWDTVYSAALRGVWKARRNWKPGKGCQFSTFAYMTTWNLVQDERDRKPQCLDIDDVLLPGRNVALLDDLYVSEILRHLDKRRGHIVHSVAVRGYKFVDVSRELGISATRVAQLYREGLERLRQTIGNMP